MAANSVGRHGRKKMIVEDILTIRNVQGMESYKHDVESLIRKALLEGGVEVLLSDIDERAEQMKGKMDDINNIFESAKDLDDEARGDVNDEAINAMLSLMSGMDQLKRELIFIEVSDPKLQAWKDITEKRVEELSSEIEAGT